MTSSTPPRGPDTGARIGARLAADSRTRPDSVGHDEDLPQTMYLLVKDSFCCVAGQGFEPWKASTDGFTDRAGMSRGGLPWHAEPRMVW